MDDFEVISLLGRGAFGKVMLVRFKKDKVIYAMKTVEKAQVIDSNEVEHILSEKNVLAKINNPFLVNMHFSFQTPTHLVFILDFCPGGELFAYLQKHKNGLSEADVKFYCAQIILALEHLHSVGVVYRDIKPENILFEKDGYLKMTDFGLAKTVKDGTTSTFCGTPEYLAPEVVQGMDYDENVDWWGLGILIYEMLFTRSPFLAETLEDLYENILQADPQYPSKKDVSLDCQDFINKLLAKSPTTRLIVQEKLPTPYVPQLKSQTDVSNFDNEIISEHVDLKSNAQPVTDASFFTDFTYVHK
ncbi:non-specific serine/threonine protein kinase [Entamoeba marina]